MQRSLEELLRRIFFERKRIEIGPVLWERDGHVALSVYSWPDRRSYDSQLVVCGQREAMAGEPGGFEDWSRKATGRTVTQLAKQLHTTHLEARLYNLVDLDWEDALSLETVYRHLPERSFTNALTNLDAALDPTRTSAHADEDGRTLAEHFRARLGIGDDRLTRAALAEQVEALVRQLPSLPARELSITCSAEKIEGNFDGRPFSYTNPALMLDSDAVSWPPASQNVTPGRLTVANILADSGGHTWLTDFADAGAAPSAWNYVELESLVRFDWTKLASLQSAHLLEERLTFGGFFDIRADDVDRPLGRPLRMIRFIRNRARRALSRNLASYRAGLLFEAISRLAGFDPARTLRRSELLRRGHARRRA